MNQHHLLAGLAAALAGLANGQTPIDSIDLSGSTLSGIQVGAESYGTPIPPTSFVDNKGGTDYLHVDTAVPASLAQAIGSLDVHRGSLNHSFEVQFGQPLHGNTLVYLLVNESDGTVNDAATIYPVDAAGNRIGTASATLSFPAFGAMPVLDEALYERTTDGAANGTLNRVLTGTVFTLDELGIGGLAGTEGLEFVTTTLDPQEVGLAFAGSAVDPQLLQDVSGGDADLEFGTVFQAPGGPAETPVRTLRYVNEGPTKSLGIGAVTASADFVVTDIAVNGSGGRTPPLVLGVGDSIEVSVKGAPARTGPQPALGMLTLDADEDLQDRVIEASATILAVGDRLNANPAFLDGAAAAGDWSQAHLRLAPGLTPGSSHAVRVYGAGDPSGAAVGQANQASAIPDGASDFEAVFVFSPVSDFAAYAGVEADGSFADRGMQYLLLATDTAVFGGAALTPADTGNILVNLAYLPDGAASGGIPGFYVFNGATASWELAVATTLAGSGDVDSDGVLDPAAGDTVEACRVSILATGFGAPGAGYEITVSTVGPAGLTDTLSSGPLAAWHGTSGESATLAAHSFTTGDQSDSNADGGLSAPFWVDFSALYHGAQPEASLSIVALPDILRADGDGSGIGSGSLVVRNDGGGATLSIDAMSFDDTAFSLRQDLPVALAPGASARFDLDWDADRAAPASAALGRLMIGSSDPSSAPRVDLVAALSSSAALNPNFDLEVPGLDPEGDSDTFVFWQEGTNARDVPGLLAGSPTAARVNGNSLIGTTFIREDPLWSAGQAWTAEAVFAIGGTDNRVFNFKVREELEGENYTEINLRYEAGLWQVFDGIPGGGGAWVTLIDLSGSPLEVSVDQDGNGSLDDEGDVKVPYRLRLSARGWAPGSTPAFDLEVLDESGGLLGSATDRGELLNGFVAEDLPSRGPNYLEVRNTGSEFWVDDVVIAGVVAGPGVEILGVSGGPGGCTILYDAGGAAVNVERSTSGLGGFTDIATGETSGSFTDSTAPAGAAFYRVYLPE